MATAAETLRALIYSALKAGVVGPQIFEQPLPEEIPKSGDVGIMALRRGAITSERAVDGNAEGAGYGQSSDRIEFFVDIAGDTVAKVDALSAKSHALLMARAGDFGFTGGKRSLIRVEFGGEDALDSNLAAHGDNVGWTLNFIAVITRPELEL